VKYHERTVLNFPRPVLQVHVCFRQRPQETTQFKEECVEQNLHTPQGQLLLLYVAQTRKPIVPASESGGRGGEVSLSHVWKWKCLLRMSVPLFQFLLLGDLSVEISYVRLSDRTHQRFQDRFLSGKNNFHKVISSTSAERLAAIIYTRRISHHLNVVTHNIKYSHRRHIYERFRENLF